MIKKKIGKDLTADRRDHTENGKMPRFTRNQRNEIQNSKTLFLADKPEYRSVGLRWARLRFTAESPEECVAVFRRYLEQNNYTPEDYTRGLFYRGVE